MKRLPIIILCMLIISIYSVVLILLIQNQHALAVASPLVSSTTLQGTITIQNTDENTGIPIKGTRFTVVDLGAEAIVAKVETDEAGVVTTDKLDYGTYKITQSSVNPPYKLDDEEYFVVINEANEQLATVSKWADHIGGVTPTADGAFQVSEVFLAVNTVMQRPELPHGCEITSLAAVLNYYDYDVTKMQLVDDYLPKEPFKTVGDKLYGANPYTAYAGDPTQETGAFFAYAGPIVTAASDYMNAVGGTLAAYDISGSTREFMFEQLNQGIPVVIWTTIDMKEPRLNFSWYIHETDQYFHAPVNSHTVVLTGYDEEKVYVMDPLKGHVSYNADHFFENYEQLGGHAMIVVDEAS